MDPNPENFHYYKCPEPGEPGEVKISFAGFIALSRRDESGEWRTVAGPRDVVDAGLSEELVWLALVSCGATTEQLRSLPGPDQRALLAKWIAEVAMQNAVQLTRH